MGILVVGSVALDTIKTPFGEKEEILGGAASYFSVAASYFTNVSMVAVVGDDFPEEHISFFEEKGIDISGLQRQKGKTFRWKGVYDTDLNTRTTLDTQLNVFADFVPQLSESHRFSEFLFLGNIDPDLQTYVLKQLRQPRLIACDTMNYWIERKPEALLNTLSMVDLLVINDEETRQLAKEQNLIRAARHILTLGPKIIVIKRGEYGALMLSPYSIFSIPAFPEENVFDPTGAGDSFAGGLMGYISRAGRLDDSALRRAVVFGSVMASYSIKGFGPRQMGNLAFQDIKSRYNEFHKLAYFDDIMHQSI
jgi:sugar/nucleoside kinase (ribokinase family)